MSHQSNAPAISPRKASTYDPKHGFMLREPTSQLAFSCMTAQEAHSPEIPILLPKGLLEELYPGQEARDLAEIPLLSRMWEAGSYNDAANFATRAPRDANAAAHAAPHSGSVSLAVPYTPAPSPPTSELASVKNPKAAKQTLKDVLVGALPGDLWAILVGGTIVDYAPHTRALRITIDDTLPRPAAAEQAWSGGCIVSSVEIVVSDSVKLTSFFKAAPYKTVLWILNWLQGAHAHTIAEISIVLPEKLDAAKNGNVEKLLSPVALTGGGGKQPVPVLPAFVFPQLKTLRWKGDACLLPKLIPALASENTRELTIISELRLTDALHALRYFTAARLERLELSTLVDDTPPPLVPAPAAPPSRSNSKEQLELTGSGKRSQSREHRPRAQKLMCSLPWLAALKLTARVPVQSLFAHMLLPRLISVFLFPAAASTDGDDVVVSASAGESESKDCPPGLAPRKYAPEEILGSLFADPIIKSHKLIYKNEQGGMESDGMENVRHLVMHRISEIGAVVLKVF